jgi:hypothetical protein
MDIIWTYLKYSCIANSVLTLNAASNAFWACTTDGAVLSHIPRNNLFTLDDPLVAIRFGVTQVFMARHTENTACLQFFGQWNLQDTTRCTRDQLSDKRTKHVGRRMHKLAPKQTYNVEVKKANLAIVPTFGWILIGPPSQIGIVVFVEQLLILPLFWGVN